MSYITNVKNQKGIGLVETIIALGIAVVVITSLVSLAVYTLRSSQQSKYLLEGSKLASEQVELVRLYKDSAAIDWATFKLKVASCPVPAILGNGPKCLIDTSLSDITTSATPYEVTLSNNAKVKRYFYVTNTADPNIVRITSVVEWKVGPNKKFTTIVTDITNWRNK